MVDADHLRLSCPEATHANLMPGDPVTVTAAGRRKPAWHAEVIVAAGGGLWLTRGPVVEARERRRHHRVTVRLEAEWVAPEGAEGVRSQRGYTVDVSESGACIASEPRPELSLGATMFVSVGLPDGPLNALARLCDVRPAEDQLAEHSVEFMSVAPEDEQRLREFVSRTTPNEE